MALEQESRNHFFIGGEWVAAASERRFPLINASTGREFASVPEAVEADVDRALPRPARRSTIPPAGRPGRRPGAPRPWHASPTH